MFLLFFLGAIFHDPHLLPPTEEMAAAPDLAQARMQNHPRGGMVVRGLQSDMMCIDRGLCPDPDQGHTLVLGLRQEKQVFVRKALGSAVVEVLVTVVMVIAVGVIGVEVEVQTEVIVGIDVDAFVSTKLDDTAPDAIEGIYFPAADL